MHKSNQKIKGLCFAKALNRSQKSSTLLLFAPLRKHNFESKLEVFLAILSSYSTKKSVINIIEKINGTPNDFNYYSVELQLAEGIEIV